MKKLLLLSLASLGILLGGCASTTAYRTPPPARVIVVYDTPAFYPMYSSWRFGYDWGFGPRYMGHGHGYWHGRR